MQKQYVESGSRFDPAAWKAGQTIRLASLPILGGGDVHEYLLHTTIGEGATSLVWKAELQDESGENSKFLALKVLKPDAGKEFVAGMKNELYILRTIEDNFQKRGVSAPPVPKVFAASPEIYDGVRYIAMDLVQGRPVASLVSLKNQLPAEAHKMRQMVDTLTPMIEEVINKIYAQAEPDSKLIAQAKELNAASKQISDTVNRLGETLDTMPEAQAQIEEIDITLIGYLSSQAFQELHQAIKSSYQDFQLKNIYYDVKEKLVKILDWNVVSKSGSVDISADLFSLAGGLFYLLTGVQPEKRRRSEELYLLGGLAWQEDVTVGLRAVLERALVSNTPKPYTAAFQWDSNARDKSLPLSSCEALGNALELLSSYWHAEYQRLEIVAGKFIEDDLYEDAEAIVQIAEARLHADQADESMNYREKFAKFRRAIEKRQTSPQQKIESVREWLRANDRQKAREALDAAIQSSPDNLTVQRWKVLFDQIEPLPFEKFSSLWAEGKLQAGMRALSEKRWVKAGEHFSSVRLPGPGVNVLSADAQLNGAFEKSESLFHAFLAAGDRNLGQAFTMQLAELRKILSSSQIGYLKLIQANWPDFEEWERMASSYQVERQAYYETKRKIEELIHGRF